MDAAELIAFERGIADAFNSGMIRAPVHLSGGNESQLIEIFKNIANDDWVCGSWRMHYQCLLKGVPPEQLRADILAGRSITLCYPTHRIISSAIVGGIVPIALGLALAIKRAGGSEKVWCFVGDMTARTGIFHECREYAVGWDLPITFIIEDNGKSVMTSTEDVWVDQPVRRWCRDSGEIITVTQVIWRAKESKTIRYFYTFLYPHAGAGKRVQF
jgi:TPP-dependent pyruvate/acetoin dehydrogenase alpha subunit